MCIRTLFLASLFVPSVAAAGPCPGGAVSTNDGAVLGAVVTQLTSSAVEISSLGSSGFCYSLESQEKVEAALFLAMQVHAPTAQTAVGSREIADVVLEQLAQASVPYTANFRELETTIHLPAQHEATVNGWLLTLQEN